MNEDKIRFTPVRGTDTAIRRLDIQDGRVYFAYDTGYVYLDKGTERYTLGGNGTGGTSFVWADAEEDVNLFKVDEESSSDPYYNMAVTAIEGIDPENPLYPQDDLMVINSDGRFFRVIGSDANAGLVNLQLIAVSGSGGGGGGGGTSSRTLTLLADGSTVSNGAAYVANKTQYITVTGNAVNGNPDTELTLTFTFTNNDLSVNNVLDFTETAISGEPFNFDTSVLPASSNYSLVVSVNSPNSGMRPKDRPTLEFERLRVITMDITKPPGNAYLPLVPADDLAGVREFRYIPVGDESLGPMTIHAYVDDVEIDLGLNKTIPTSSFNKIGRVGIERQSHGVHKIKLAVSATMQNREIYSDFIEYEGAWATEGETTPIIWIGNYDKVITNYENSYIYYMVYDPLVGDLPADIHLYRNDAEVNQVEEIYSKNNWHVWDISTLYELNENTFSIVCRSEKVDIPITVTNEGARQLDLVGPSSLILANYSSSGRSSSEIESRRIIFSSSTYSDNSYAELKNFNWRNNGWMNSEGPDAEGIDSGSYLSIANDAALDITLLDNEGPRALSLNSDKDYTFEFRFRVRNVQEYSTLIKVIPKYFYDIPIVDPETGDITWEKTYNMVLIDDEEIPKAKTGYSSKYESEIIEAGYRIGVDKYGNLLMDTDNTLKVADTSSGVVVKWLNDEGYGFCVGTQEAYFRTPSGIANVRYCEDKVINLSFVVSKTDHLCYVYLNGILSGVTALPTAAGSYFNIRAPFEFNSDYCDFDLYRFRIYQTGLTMPNVIHNYIADMHNTKLYDQNQITDPLDPTALSYDLLLAYNRNHPDALSMPYATWEIIDGDDELLPWKKGNNRIANIEFVNPTADKLLEDGTISEWEYYTHCPSFYCTGLDINVQGTSSQKYPRRNYKTKMKNKKAADKGFENVWTFTKGSLAGKSMTKDYTVLDKNGIEHTLVSKFHMDTNTVGVNKFTWKIDYMESSESYNAGFANLMGNLSHPLYTKHPLADLRLGLDTSDLRTSVYGFPVLTFHKYTRGDNAGKYEYIGKYSLNLDKSANEAYGYELDVEQPYVAQRTKQVLNEETGEYESVQYQPTIAEIAECWEMKDNQGNWCSLRYPTDEARISGFGTLKEGTSGETAKLEILDHFEYRYSYYADQLDSAYEYKSFTDPTTQVKYTNNGQINTYLREKHSNLEALFNWLDSTDTSVVIPGEEATLDSPVTYQVSSVVTGDNSVTYTQISDGLWEATFTKDTKEYRRQKFRAEFEDHLDKEYCLTYFVMTELLLCYDSRGKNMMLATFGPHRRNGNYIWYPVFYDIDTQLGLNNSGAYLWDYDADVTTNNLFSTPTSVLWNNLYDVFYDDIVQKCRVLRGVKEPGDEALINGSLTENNIIGAYEFNPQVFNSYAMRGVRPIVAIGLDEYYKYLAPALTAQDYLDGKMYAGYYDTTGNHTYQPNGPTYAYCAQGDKKLTTELLIRNRLNYIDSWWMAGDYRAEAVVDQIFIRGNANLSGTSDIYLNTGVPLPEGNTFENADYPVEYYDARPGFKIKPYLHQYISYFHDSIISTPKKYDSSSDPEGEWTNVDQGKLSGYKNSPDYSQQIMYLPGADYISSFGDLSLSYPNALQIKHGKKLLDLKPGSDAPDYKNPFFLNSTGSGGTDFELCEMPLLRKVNWSNLEGFTGELTFTGSAKLQEFRALGSGIERVNFAGGSPLHTVHLPESITLINLVQHEDLTDIIRSKPHVISEVNGELVVADPEDYRGLYIEGVTDYTNDRAGLGHNINTYIVSGGNLEYKSYEILNNLYKLKNGAQNNSHLSIALTDVHWSPYVQVEKGELYISGDTYYYLNDHNTFETYPENPTAEKWNKDLLNERVYTFNGNEDAAMIQDLSLLDNFIAEYKAAKLARRESQFSNISGSSSATIPTITGDLYVNNITGDEILEAKLGEGTEENPGYAYYWPQLKITAKRIHPSNIAKFIQIAANGKEEEVDIKKFDDTYLGQSPEMTTKIPTKTNYTFVGWALDTEGTQIVYNFNIQNQNLVPNPTYVNDPAFIFSAQNNVITLYAIFTKKLYKVNYYNWDKSLIEIDANNPQLYETPGNAPERVTMLVAHGDTLPIMPVYPSRPYTDDTKVAGGYVFIGWSATENGRDVVTNLDTQIVNANLNYYAVFKEVENIRTYPTDDKFFDITAAGLVRAADNVKLSGKIVIPKFVKNKTTGISTRVVGVEGTSASTPAARMGHGFFDQKDITHILLQDPTSFNDVTFTVSENSFGFVFSNEGANKLRYVELPTSGNIIISNGAFRNAHQLFKDIPEDVVRDFFSRISYIGQQSFRSVSEGFTAGIFLPANITQVNQQAFQECGTSENAIIDIVIGTPQRHVNVGDIQFNGSNIFGSSSTSHYRNITIYSDDELEDWESVFAIFDSNGFTYSGTRAVSHATA